MEALMRTSMQELMVSGPATEENNIKLDQNGIVWDF
jgi:hypothetical protein